MPYPQTGHTSTIIRRISGKVRQSETDALTTEPRRQVLIMYHIHDFSVAHVIGIRALAFPFTALLYLYLNENSQYFPKLKYIMTLTNSITFSVLILEKTAV